MASFYDILYVCSVLLLYWSRLYISHFIGFLCLQVFQSQDVTYLHL